MKKLINVCVIGGVGLLAIAVIMRLTNLQPSLTNPVQALWMVSTSLLLIAIAMGANK